MRSGFVHIQSCYLWIKNMVDLNPGLKNCTKTASELADYWVGEFASLRPPRAPWENFFPQCKLASLSWIQHFYGFTAFAVFLQRGKTSKWAQQLPSVPAWSPFNTQTLLYIIITANKHTKALLIGEGIANAFLHRESGWGTDKETLWEECNKKNKKVFCEREWDKVKAIKAMKINIILLDVRLENWRCLECMEFDYIICIAKNQPKNVENANVTQSR